MKKLGTLANAAGVVALTLLSAFNAQAETPAHPILDAYTGATHYSGALVGVIANTGVPNGQLLGGSAVVQLETALKSPQNSPRPSLSP